MEEKIVVNRDRLIVVKAIDKNLVVQSHRIPRDILETFLKTRMALKFKNPEEGFAYCINKRYVSKEHGTKLYPALKKRFNTHPLYQVDGWTILEIPN